MNERKKKIIYFISISFFISWSLVAIYAFFGGEWRGTSGALIALLYMMSPLVATVFVQKIIFRENIIKPLNIRFLWNRWWTVAWLIPPLFALATFAISLLFPTVEYSADFSGMIERLTQDLSPEQMERIRQQLRDLPFHPLFLPILQTLVAGITINTLVAFGEEIGWRGLLQKELARFGFWKSSMVIGIIWGVWHAPAILMGHNYPEHRVLGVFMMIAWTVLLSPLFAWVRYRGKSVIVAAIVHGTLNASPVLALLMIKGGNELLIGITGLSGLIVLVLINICIWLFEKFLFATSTNHIMQSTHQSGSEGQ